MTEAEQDRVLGQAVRLRREEKAKLKRLRCRAAAMAQEAERVVKALREEHTADFPGTDGFCLSVSREHPRHHFEKCAYPTAKEVVEILRDIHKAETQVETLSKTLDEMGHGE